MLPAATSIEIFPDENGYDWCAVYGPDRQNGLVGYGKTPGEALRNLAEQDEELNLIWNILERSPSL